MVESAKERLRTEQCPVIKINSTVFDDIEKKAHRSYKCILLAGGALYRTAHVRALVRVTLLCS